MYVWDHPFNTRTAAYYRVRNVNFSENFVYVANGWFSCKRLKHEAKPGVFDLWQKQKKLKKKEKENEYKYE